MVLTDDATSRGSQKVRDQVVRIERSLVVESSHGFVLLLVQRTVSVAVYALCELLLGSKPFSECCDALRRFFITDILYLFLNPPVHATPLSISMGGTLTKSRAKLEISAHVDSLDSLYLSRVRVPRCLRPTDLSPCAATASPLLRSTYEMAALSPPL